MDTQNKETTTSGYTEDLSQEMESVNPLPVEEGFSHLQECYVSVSGHVRLFSAVRYGKRYMLKCLKPDYLYIPVYRQALTKEFEIGLQLDHPYICRTIGLEQVEGLGTAIVMEYVDGETLQNLMDRKMLTTEIAHKIIRQLMDALEYMHNKQIIHRDLKPANIMLTHQGQNVKLIDFGLSDSSAFTVLKLPAGTSGYIAPEQMMPEAKSEPRADIYSLGRVMTDMAKSTRDKRLEKMAAICACRDPYHRPDSIRKARKRMENIHCWSVATVILSVLAGLLAVAIAVAYVCQPVTSGAHSSSAVTTDSVQGDGNRALDYSLWPQ